MEKGRFSLLLLDPGEIYFEDFSAVLITYDTTIKTLESKKSDGRLKLCSKSLVFDPKESSKPLIKIPLKDCDIIEIWRGSRSFIKGRNALRIECRQYAEMLEGNAIAPYVFKDKGRFIVSLNFTSVDVCLPQICQLKRAMSLNAIEQAQMIAAIVFSKHAMIQFDPLWMEFFESVDLELQANKVTPMVVNPGRVVLSEYKLYFQPYNNVEVNPVIKISLSTINRIVKRRFLLRHIGIEIYYTSNNTSKESHIYLTLLDETERDQFYDRLLSQKNLKLTCPDQDMMTLQWQNGVISNYDYLVYINSLGDRTKNDLTQYPVFPWVILDYTSSTIDLNDESIYRDLSKPMGALNEDRWAKLKERYDEMPEPKFMYGSHYSTPGYVLFYLVRLYPEYMLCLQNGRFDHPDRMFNSMIHLCKNSLSNMTDFKELIPEFYDVENGGAFLVNGYGIDFGYRHNDVKVDDVELPPWASSPDDLIRILREALESDYVSRNLHSWIDLIFGYKQRGEEAVRARNLFYHLCYEGSVDLNAVESFNDRHTLEVQIMEFGQIPKQVFKVPHPKKLLEPTIMPDSEASLNDGWKTAAEIKPLATFSTHKTRVNSVYIGDDNDKVVSAAHDSKVKIFSLSLNRQVRSAPIGNMPLSSCLKLPEFNVLVIGNLGNEIALYDLDYGAITETVAAHEDAVTCLKWSAKLSVLFSGSGDGSVAMWKGFKLKPMKYLLRRFDHNSQVNCIALDRSEDCLAAGTDDGEVYIWNLTECTLNRKFRGHKSAVKGVDYSPDGKILVSCSLDGTFHVLDVNTGTVLYKKATESPLTCLRFDTCLFIGAQNGILHIWDMVEVKALHEIKAHDGAILSLDISPDKKHLVTGGEDNLVKVWQPA